MIAGLRPATGLHQFQFFHTVHISTIVRRTTVFVMPGLIYNSGSYWVFMQVIQFLFQCLISIQFNRMIILLPKLKVFVVRLF